ncbi:MAG: glycosyltransferase family 39 protein, partial [Bdellovibrionales bacterium]|nr:glycosyltransferase family 39 protein [Bdellovibrionales bacterium]
MESISNCHSAADHRTTIVLSLLLIMTCLVLFLPGISTPFVTTGEPREALVPQTMALEKDLLQSVRYGDDIATKPPLFHWAIVAASTLTGSVSEASSRLPSVVASSVCLIAWTLFLIPLLGRQRSMLFFLVLATAGEWYRHAAHARVDMLLTSFVCLALLCLYRWLEKPSLVGLLLSTILMAGAALTKGPIGVALPLAITGLTALFWRELTIKKCFQLGIAGTL